MSIFLVSALVIVIVFGGGIKFFRTVLAKLAGTSINILSIADLYVTEEKDKKEQTTGYNVEEYVLERKVNFLIRKQELEKKLSDLKIKS